MNLFNKISISSLIMPLIVYRSSIRSMHKIVSRSVNMNLIRRNSLSQRDTQNIAENSRGMACFHGARFKPMAPKPPVKDIDVSGYHVVITKTTCNESNCNTVNCADPTDSNVNCPSRTATENQTGIPPTSQGFKPNAGGNLTSKIPKNKRGVTIDQNQNYTGQANAQQMVTETNPVTVPSDDLHVDSQSTSFLQQHHTTIIKQIP